MILANWKWLWGTRTLTSKSLKINMNAIINASWIRNMPAVYCSKIKKLWSAKLRHINMAIYNKFFSIIIEAFRIWGDSNNFVSRVLRESGCFFNSLSLFGIIAKIASSPPDTMETSKRKNKLNNNKLIPFPCKSVKLTGEFIFKMHKNGSIVSKVDFQTFFLGSRMEDHLRRQEFRLHLEIQ